MKTNSLLFLIIFILGCQSENDCLLSNEDLKRNTNARNVFGNGNNEEAIAITNKSIELNPNNFIAYSIRGEFLQISLENDTLSEKQKNQIFSDYKKSIELCTNYNFAYRNLINIAYEFKEFETVIKYVNEYNNKFEKSNKLLTKLGDAYWEKGKYKKGIEVLNEVIEAEEVSISNYAYIVRGKCYEKLGNFDKAIKDFNEAIIDNSYLLYQDRACQYFDLTQKNYLEYKDHVKVEKLRETIKRSINRFCKEK